VVTTLALAPYAGWLYTICAAGLGAWFLVEAHRLYGQVARADESASQAVAAISAGATAAVAAAPAVTGTGKTAEVPVTKSRGPLGHRGVAGGRSPELATAEGTCAGIARPSPHPAPMRLFHLSIAYLTLLFAAIAVVSLLPVGRW
jgi:heme O synthase-like polyprenyltransferase